MGNMPKKNLTPVYETLTSGELLSNDGRAVHFGSSQLGLRDAGIGGRAERVSGMGGCARAGREGIQIARLEEGEQGCRGDRGGGQTFKTKDRPPRTLKLSCLLETVSVNRILRD